MDVIKPVRILEVEENVYIYDLGQNFSGWSRLRVSGPRGAKVTLRHAGRLYSDHRLDARNNGGANQTDTYILKGEGVEVWEPRFTLHGFRYVEVTGFPGTPTLENLQGCFVRSAVKSSGSFRCSNPLINRIHHNVRWTFMSSFQSIPQDAAERAERVGWLGDTGFVAEDYMYNFDDASFWSKWLDDINDSQKPDGDVPVVSPLHWRNIYQDWPAWKSSYPLFVWYIYRYYDDEQVLEKHYDGLKQLLDFLGTLAEDYIISCGLGDHMEPQTKLSSFNPRHTPASLTSTAYYYYDAWIQSQAAEILGKSDDVKRYSNLAENIKDAFNREFLNEDTNQYATNSQTSNALPLYMGLVPEGREKAVAKNLAEHVITTHNGHLSTGIIGTNALEQALPEYGWANVMYELTTQTTFPSWGYEVLKGATTIWETFEYCPQHCLNMKMFGSVEIFLYKCLAGLSPARPGYRELAIKPHIVDDLKDVSASISTPRGEAKSSWTKYGNGLHLDVTIPVNSQAKVSVPKMGLEHVTIKESQKIIWKDGSYVGGAAGISGGSEDAWYVTFDVGSGSYSFEIQSATPRKPQIEYSALEAPESVKPGESFQVSATVKNVSEYNLLPEIPLTHSRIVYWQVIPLESGESRKVTFTLELDEGEELDVSIGSLPPKTVSVETDG
jgi:alpha-L-rhamnosidase